MSGWTVNSLPPTRCPGPTVSIGRTVGLWAALTPTWSSMCPWRTAGGATSAWSTTTCVASPGLRSPTSDLSPTLAGFTKERAGRRTAWLCITVSNQVASGRVSEKQVSLKENTLLLSRDSSNLLCNQCDVWVGAVVFVAADVASCGYWPPEPLSVYFCGVKKVQQTLNTSPMSFLRIT